MLTLGAKPRPTNSSHKADYGTAFFEELMCRRVLPVAAASTAHSSDCMARNHLFIPGKPETWSRVRLGHPIGETRATVGEYGRGNIKPFEVVAVGCCCEKMRTEFDEEMAADI